MQRRSRLNRTTAEKTKKQIITQIAAIIIVLILLIQLGPMALNAVGGVISSFQSGSKEQTNEEEATLEAPFIESIPDATNSAEIIISGSSPYGDAEIELYVNDSEHDSIPLDKDQTFTFSSVVLKEGDNYIKARVKKGENTSFFTREYLVTYSKGDPKLEVGNPSENQEFTKGDQTINVTGKTDPENSITVNGFRAIVDGDGNFSYYLRLNDGDNQVKIEATSPGGKTTSKEMKVVYKP